ncbi:MAG: hypothetical protein J6J23_06650 [Clostridia bacterium]|nr:hypothetical protein [Clostridia bacterium]
MKKKKKYLAPLLSIIVAIVGVLGGYMIGSQIANKKFIVDKYANLNAEYLFDDITKLNYQGKTPNQFSAAEVFQIGASIQQTCDYYKSIGTGDLQTNLGVSQGTFTLDEKNGNTVHIVFVSSSSYVKVAQQSTFEIGGNVNMQHGETKDGVYENVVWKDKYDEYTWEGYREKFGKYANTNSSYIVSSKTVLSQKFDGKNGNLYTFTIELDPILGTVTYAQQIAANLGIEPSAINFKKLTLTFTVDDQFRILVQDKAEEYSVPMFGMNIELVGTIHNETVYE